MLPCLVRGLHNLYPTGSGYGYGTVKGSDFFKTAGFAEDNDVSNQTTTITTEQILSAVALTAPGLARHQEVNPCFVDSK